MTPRLAVCEAGAEMQAGDAAWERVVAAARRIAADLLLLNEMPFGPWIAAAERPDPAAAAESRRLHEDGMGRLGELGVPVVLGSRPVAGGRAAWNQAFLWTAAEGPRPAGHTKQFFPDEEGYWEARWFEPGPERFGIARPPAPGGGIRVGFLICTDVWFNERARAYGRRGVDLIAVPRATPAASTDRWRTAVRMAALVSGCYVASSNRAGTDSRGQTFGGRGWIFSPDGDLLAETSDASPVAVAEIDLDLVIRARQEYPRYVEKLDPRPAGSGRAREEEEREGG